MAPSPVGIEISKGKRTWKVGKKLGSGACATVCALKSIDNGSSIETDFAVKMAPLAKKKTKKGNSPAELNAKLLYYEQLVYSTQFRPLQGNFIPTTPSASSKDPPIYGDENGTILCFLFILQPHYAKQIPILTISIPSMRLMQTQDTDSL